jgi:hypothetical protein
MPKAIDFTSMSMRVPPGSREWSRRSGLVVRTLSTTRTASRGGIEGLPLLIHGAAHHGGRGQFSLVARMASSCFGVATRVRVR